MIMPHVSMRAYGVGAPLPLRGSGLSPMSKYMQQQLQQGVAEGQVAAQVCNDSRFTTPTLKAACIESAGAAAAAGLGVDQLLALSKAKVQCHGFFDSLGIAADDATMSQCITDPVATLSSLCATPGASSLPACQQFAASQSFVTKYKKPLLIGGGLALAALILKVVL